MSTRDQIQEKVTALSEEAVEQVLRYIESLQNDTQMTMLQRLQYEGHGILPSITPEELPERTLLPSDTPSLSSLVIESRR